MKVGFQYGIGGYSGKLDGLVYYYDKVGGRVYARKWVYPRLTQENERIGIISDNLFALKPSDAYKDNLRLNVTRYNALKSAEHKPVRSWVNIYLKMMYNMAKLMPEVDLRTISRETIYQNDLPCKSVKQAVEAGLLPVVKGYERMNAEI
jgi:hypothetical protein